MATVLCRYCDWTAVHHGDTQLEEAHFLRAQLIEHVKNKHPDRPHASVEHVIVEEDKDPGTGL